MGENLATCTRRRPLCVVLDEEFAHVVGVVVQLFAPCARDPGEDIAVPVSHVCAFPELVVWISAVVEMQILGVEPFHRDDGNYN